MVNGSEIKLFHQLSGVFHLSGQRLNAIKCSKASQAYAAITQPSNAHQRFAPTAHREEPMKIQNPRCGSDHTSKNEYPVLPISHFILHYLFYASNRCDRYTSCCPLVCLCNGAYSIVYHRPHKSVLLARSPFASRDNENRLVCLWVWPLSEDFQHQ